MIITFAANAAAKNESFSQKFPGNAAVLFRPYPRRGFLPPFTAIEAMLKFGPIYLYFSVCTNNLVIMG